MKLNHTRSATATAGLPFGVITASVAPVQDALLNFRLTTSSPTGAGTGSFTLDTSVENWEKSSIWGLYPNAISEITINESPIQSSYFLRTAAIGSTNGEGSGSYWEIFLPTKHYLLAFVFADEVNVELVNQLSEITRFTGILWEYKGLNWNIDRLELALKVD